MSYGLANLGQQDCWKELSCAMDCSTDKGVPMGCGLCPFGWWAAAPLCFLLLCEKAAPLLPDKNFLLLTLRWIRVGYPNIIRFSERLLALRFMTLLAACWKHSFRWWGCSGCVQKPRLLLLGMMAAVVMAAMAAQFIRLSAEKWTPQRHVVFLKKLNDWIAVCQIGWISRTVALFNLPFIFGRLNKSCGYGRFNRVTITRRIKCLQIWILPLWDVLSKVEEKEIKAKRSKTIPKQQWIND